MTETYTITPLTTPNEQPAILRNGQRMTIHEVCRELNRMSGEAKAKNYTDETRWKTASHLGDGCFRIRLGVVQCLNAITQSGKEDWVPYKPFPTAEWLLLAEQRGELIRVVP